MEKLLSEIRRLVPTNKSNWHIDGHREARNQIIALIEENPELLVEAKEDLRKQLSKAVMRCNAYKEAIPRFVERIAGLKHQVNQLRQKNRRLISQLGEKTEAS